jgi:hypothetical protein
MDPAAERARVKRRPDSVAPPVAAAGGAPTPPMTTAPPPSAAPPIATAVGMHERPIEGDLELGEVAALELEAPAPNRRR